MHGILRLCWHILLLHGVLRLCWHILLLIWLGMVRSFQWGSWCQCYCRSSCCLGCLCWGLKRTLHCCKHMQELRGLVVKDLQAEPEVIHVPMQVEYQALQQCEACLPFTVWISARDGSRVGLLTQILASFQTINLKSSIERWGLKFLGGRRVRRSQWT